MELKDLLKIISKNATTLVLFSLSGGLFGLLVYLLPTKYISTGSFYVTRTIEHSTQFFTYEGYYSQQTAVAYTNTATALLESLDVKTQSLETAGIEPNEQNLRKYSKYIDVKKKGPQLITLVVRDTSPEKSELLWTSLADTFIAASDKANTQVDSNLHILKISDKPVVKPEYKSLYLDLLAGLVAGFIGGITFGSVKIYFKK